LPDKRLHWKETNPIEPTEREKDIQKILKEESVGVQAAYHYLSNLSYQLWADWYISFPERRLEAARWLDKQIRGVNKVRRKGDWNPS
jgi:hypothetical protein